MGETLIHPIADIQTDFDEKFGIPRQSGRAPDLKGTIIFREPYRNPEALRGLEEFSHIWLIFDFSKSHQNKWSPTVRPPRLGGNKRIGVFACRSPFRPNSIGLSCVRLEQIKKTEKYGHVLIVAGVDLLNGTPIFDIKPYIPYADCHTNAVGSFADIHAADSVEVNIPEDLIRIIPEEKINALIQCLSDNPCPQYQKDSSRVYKMSFSGMDVHFTLDGKTLSVTDIVKKK